MPSSCYKIQHMGQTIQFSQDVVVLPRDLCNESTHSIAALLCAQRGFRTAVWLWFCPFPKGFVQVQMVMVLWEIQPVLPIQPTCLEKTVTHPLPSKCIAGTGVTQAGSGGGWAFMLTLFWQVNVLISKEISCSGTMVSALCSHHLAGPPRVLAALW